MHMRIRYHFLVDLHVTRHSRETESEKSIRNILNFRQERFVVQGFNEILNKTKAAHAARNSERMRYNN